MKISRCSSTPIAILAAVLATSCHHDAKPQAPRPPSTGTTTHPQPPSGGATSGGGATTSGGPGPVAPAKDAVIVSAWSEPKRLPPGGGQAQILVRLRKKGGAPYPGVEVRLETSTGTLFSAGRILTTDGAGMTRDRLTAHHGASVIVNAGGTLYRFEVPVAGE
jgi:hypothetical protein